MTIFDLSPANSRHEWPERAPARGPRRVGPSGPTLVLIDAVAIGTATFAAVLGRNHLPFFDAIADIEDVAQSLAVPIGLLWLALLFLFGAYSMSQIGVGSLELNRVTLASVAAAGVVGIACYLAKFQLSRGFFVLLFVIGIPLLLMGRVVRSRIMGRLRSQGHFRTNILLAGTGHNVDVVGQILQRERWLGHDVVGVVTSPGSSLTETPAGVPVVGHMDAVLEAVERVGADAIIFTEGSFRRPEEFRRAAWDLEAHHVQMIVVPQITDIAKERVQVRPVAGLPLVYVSKPQSEAAGRWMKRAFDLVGSLALLVLFSPMLVVVAGWIRLSDGGPALFRQTRAGKDGTPFSCFKFRSMVIDAEARADELSHLNETDGLLFKMADDPRITRPGRFIRRYSIDELPQLWNVVKGEMSLVGPRPLPRDKVDHDGDAYRRLRVRPGMTGLWQVPGRSDLPWDETLRLDLYYVDNWSIFKDLSILWRTASVVVSGRGAY